MKQRLVLIGNGMAGVRTLEELLELAPELYDVTVFGAEPHCNYNRIMLSPLLAGDTTADDIVINDRAWYERHSITLHTGARVVEIDRARRVVRADNGVTATYDRLILATGSTPIVLPLPGHELPGVLTFRDIRDVERMVEHSREYSRAVVIGGGLLGLEAANGLLRRGMEVTVVHLLDSLMEKQLDPPSADMLRRSLEDRGLVFRMSSSTQAICGDERVEGVRFADGTEIPADLVVMAVGIRPNAELARDAGLVCERGVLVDDTMQSYDPRIYAVGECVQHRGVSYGLVAPLFEQARVCANQLACDGYFRYRGSIASTKLKVTGIDLFSVGELQGGPGCDELLMQDPGRGVYKKLVVRDDKLTGAVLYGDTSSASWYQRLIRDGADIGELRDRLLVGPNAGSGGSGVEALADDAQVCDCNGVCKGAIVESIHANGLSSLAEVRTYTKASASCGSCTPQVEQLLQLALGDDYCAPAVQPLCGCTDKSHDDVRSAISGGELASIPAVMSALGWSTPDGCARCRPAINYYLLCRFPTEYADDGQSRFVNERVHANIQKDGTYSVVPRIFGGVTTPDQLRAIADAADKFDVRTLKITGGQRIDLFGVRKPDLPAIWADLGAAGFVSGHAYGKALRTVKTCVGSEWCRFGVQDSTSLGQRLEHMTWGSWMPHKFKMAVSGCPRNCAEATIKDFGVVAIDSGWELHVGGNGGMKVRATDVLCRVATMEQVEEHCAAFVQLYREDARYLERTAPWIERVGLDSVVSQIVEDADNRRALAERFALSQTNAQKDPWAGRTGDGEFVPLSRLGYRNAS